MPGLDGEGPTAGPVMSPVLTPLDFFFWVYAKDMVYKTAVNDIDYLKKKEKNPRICEIGDC